VGQALAGGSQRLGCFVIPGAQKRGTRGTRHGLILLQKNLDVLEDTAFEGDWPIDQLILRIDGFNEPASKEFSERLQTPQAPVAKLLSIRQL